MSIPTQGIDPTTLDEAGTNAMAILTQIAMPAFISLKHLMDVGMPAVVGPQTLSAFVALCRQRGLDLTDAGVLAFKTLHDLGDGAAIGPTTAAAYADALTAGTPSPTPGRHATANGRHIIENFEGLEQLAADGTVHAYLDQVGVPTIGYGHTAGVHMGQVVTRAECDAFLASDMAVAEEAVARNVHVTLTDNQFDALVSFTFNCGTGALAGSTLLRKLNAGDYQGAADSFGMWVNGSNGPLPGLVARRAEERALFLRS